MSQILGFLLYVTVFLGLVLFSRSKIEAPPHSSSFTKLVDDDGKTFESFFKVPPSILSWENLELQRRFTVLSMSVDHHSDTSWYMPSLHARNSIGYNRTLIKNNFLTRPYACTLRFIAISLESNLKGFQEGGTGYITLAFEADKKSFWHGFDQNETNKVHCYYLTNKDTGSEFIDKPKSLGLAISCPIYLDDEVGEFHFKRPMEQGYYCRPLADRIVQIELHLRSSNYIDVNVILPSTSAVVMTGNSNESVPAPQIVPPKHTEIVSEFLSPPQAERSRLFKEEMLSTQRRHSVVTVQTFMHSFSGVMLYMFIKYYQLMGWKVIVYDRFGAHKKFIEELLELPGVSYFPFTAYQLAQPSKYNAKYKAEAGSEMKTFYKMEANWGYSSKKLADTADQDMDKTRTYDMARLEFSHLDSMLFADADEFFFCPQANDNIQTQKLYQQRIHDDFQARGTEEMRYVRLPYSGRAPSDFINNAQNRSAADFTNHTGNCMVAAYGQRSLVSLFSCWSQATSYDNFPKSSDFASVCPFHYNHWSCDGMRGGGRDFTKKRCRCKVSFDMQNEFDYRPYPRKCHMLHLNDNKYRFQSKRTKHVYDKGDLNLPCPIAGMLENEKKRIG